MTETWNAAIERFRLHATKTDAARLYVALLEDAQERWQSTVAVHDWRLDVLALTPRSDSSRQVQAEYRRRDGQSIVVFTLGPAGMKPVPTVASDICRPETAPAVLDAFLLQIAEPSRA